MITPVIGQRWVSETEPELGLGIIVQVQEERLLISFPGGDETRWYAIDSAPLTRVRFAVGDTVSGEDDVSFKVEAVTENDGVLVYSGSGGELSEADVSHSMTFGKPEGRLLAGQVDDSRAFELLIGNLIPRDGASEARG